MIRSSALCLILALVPVFLVPASGVRARVWGMDPETLASRLSDGDHEFLRHIPMEDHRIREIERLGDDASFALGLIYGDLGLPAIAIELLEHARVSAPEPYSTRALEALLPMLAEQGLEERRKSLAEELADEEELWKQTLLTRMYYEDQDYAAVLERAVPQLQLARAELSPASTLRQELELWVAVSMSMEEREGGLWREAMRAIFRDYPATSIHSRLFLFLLFRDELREAFDASEREFFRGKQLLSEGTFADASSLFHELAQGPDSPGRELLLAPYGIFDLFRAAAAASDTVAAGTLGRLATELDSLRAARALEYSGRVLRAAGAPTAAIAPLERALEQLPTGEDDQRIRWYLWSSRVRSDTGGTAAAIGQAVATFEDPEYYGDLLSELAERLIADADWSGLLSAYRGIEAFAEPGVLARYELVLATLYEKGMLPATESRAAGLRTDLLENAARQTGDRFSSLVAATLLGNDGIDALGLTQIVRDPESVESAGSALAQTYFAYGLFDRLADHLRAVGNEIAPARAERYARRLHELGEYSMGIVATNWISSVDGELSPERAELRYPRAYATIIDSVAEAEQLDPWTHYALIREESLFQARVVSIAGAQGLSQLMTATADDIARRMRLSTFDLSDPTDNLAIGARYFGLLTEQFESPARAIAAYNGGQGNVRRWERQWDTDDELLFHQRIPFAETFNHVRKVVVSAAYYGYLYAQRSPAETVRMLFLLPVE